MKIALVGCGAAAERYYIPAFKQHPELLGDLYVVDRDRSRAQNVIDQLGNGKFVQDYKPLLGEVQAAVIALPNVLHHPVGMDFLRAKKHVLCEKPLADNYGQAVEMTEAAGQSGVALCVNHTRRMFPSNQAIRKVLAANQLGRVKSIHYTEGSMFGWASATGFYVNPKLTSKGLLSDVGPHVIDMICWWLGGKPDVLRFIDDSFGGPESVAKVEAQYDGGRIDIFLNRLVDLESAFEIRCERGTICGKPMDWGRYVLRTADGKQSEVKIPCSQKNYPAFMLPIFDNFIKAAQGLEKPLVSGQDVLPSLAFIDQCYEKRQRFAMPWYDRIQVKEAKENRTVLVTGATGFIGASIVETLHLSKERRVKAVVHNWSNAARLGRFPVDIVPMDLMDEKAVAQALEGVDAVIHCAKGPYDVTVHGTENLLKMTLKKGIKRFVHLSTTEVYGNRQGQVAEDAPLSYTGNEYNRMKVDAEKQCWQYKEKGVPVVILRPSIVYGPFSKNWTLHIARMLIEKKTGVYEGIGEGKCNLVYISDLIDAIMQGLDSDKAVGEAFNVVGPDILTWNDYFKQMNTALKLPPIKVIPKHSAGLKTAALLPVRKVGVIVKDHFMGPVKKLAETFAPANTLMRSVEKLLKTTPVADELRLFAKDAVYPAGKSRQIGYQPAVSAGQGIQLSVQWLLHNHVLRDE